VRRKPPGAVKGQRTKKRRTKASTLGALARRICKQRLALSLLDEKHKDGKITRFQVQTKNSDRGRAASAPELTRGSEGASVLKTAGARAYSYTQIPVEEVFA